MDFYFAPAFVPNAPFNRLNHFDFALATYLLFYHQASVRTSTSSAVYSALSSHALDFNIDFIALFFYIDFAYIVDFQFCFGDARVLTVVVDAASVVDLPLFMLFAFILFLPDHFDFYIDFDAALALSKVPAAGAIDFPAHLDFHHIDLEAAFAL